MGKNLMESERSVCAKDGVPEDWSTLSFWSLHRDRSYS